MRGRRVRSGKKRVGMGGEWGNTQLGEFQISQFELDHQREQLNFYPVLV